MPECFQVPSIPVGIDISTNGSSSGSGQGGDRVLFENSAVVVSGNSSDRRTGNGGDLNRCSGVLGEGDGMRASSKRGSSGEGSSVGMEQWQRSCHEREP